MRKERDLPLYQRYGAASGVGKVGIFDHFQPGFGEASAVEKLDLSFQEIADAAAGCPAG